MVLPPTSLKMTDLWPGTQVPFLSVQRSIYDLDEDGRHVGFHFLPVEGSASDLAEDDGRVAGHLEVVVPAPVT